MRSPRFPEGLWPATQRGGSRGGHAIHTGFAARSALKPLSHEGWGPTIERLCGALPGLAFVAGGYHVG